LLLLPSGGKAVEKPLLEDAIAQDQHHKNRPRLAIPHTQIHRYLRRTLEMALDVVVVLLLVMLLAVTVQALWKLGQMIFYESTPYPTLLSHIVFVLILAELYRTLIFYLREHRVSVALIVEVAIVSTVQDLMLKSAHEFERQRVFGGAVLLLVLGGLLALERYFGQLSGASDTSAH
jgi:uncharacterized membrane protein (DUF373 family)